MQFWAGCSPSHVCSPVVNGGRHKGPPVGRLWCSGEESAREGSPGLHLLSMARAACSAVGAPRPRPRSGRVAEPIPSAHLAKRAFPPHKSSPSSRQRKVCCESPALDSAWVRGSDESSKRLFLFRWAFCTCGPKADVGRVYQEFWLMPRIIAQKRIFIYFLVTLFICVCYKPFKITL